APPPPRLSPIGCRRTVTRHQRGPAVPACDVHSVPRPVVTHRSSSAWSKERHLDASNDTPSFSSFPRGRTASWFHSHPPAASPFQSGVRKEDDANRGRALPPPSNPA